jgi:hypothetical protein
MEQFVLGMLQEQLGKVSETYVYVMYVLSKKYVRIHSLTDDFLSYTVHCWIS